MDILDNVELGYPSVSTFVQQIAPDLLEMAKSVSSRVGTVYRVQLHEIGAKAVNSAVMGVADAMPPLLRYMILTSAERAELQRPKSELPQWVKDVANPIVNPIVEGAKEEAKRRASIVAPRAFTTISILALTIFSIGYIFGVRKARKL